MTRRFLFIEVDFILNHRRGSGRKGEARMRSGRKGEERRECIQKTHPPRILFCFLYFIIREIRGGERREFILNSTPLESSFVFRISFFENSEEKGEGNLF